MTPSDLDRNGPRHESSDGGGVFGIYLPDEFVSHLTFDGLQALQHRGMAAAGMAVADGRSISVLGGAGHVSSAFNEDDLDRLAGRIGLGQVGSSTAVSSAANAPLSYRLRENGSGFAIGNDGNLTNTAVLVELHPNEVLRKGPISTPELIAELISTHLDTGEYSGFLVRAIRSVLPRLEGAFSMVLTDGECLVGVRDPNGLRPLCLGRLEGGWAIGSESPALEAVGAHFVREIDPGEMVVIEGAGIRSLRPFASKRVEPKLCLMEGVSLARPDSQFYGREVHGARRRMGELLAEHAPLPPSDRFFDRPPMVIGVPDSGVAGAEGFALHSGIPLGEGLVKNRFEGREVGPSRRNSRSEAARRMFSPLIENVSGKRIVVVADSILRGVTTRSLMNMLRSAGAVEVHLRLSSPPQKWPCFYGVETGARAELLAAGLDQEEMRSYLNVDSLGYLSLANLKDAIGAPGAGFCDACFTGNYPTQVPVQFLDIRSETDDEVAQL